MAGPDTKSHPLLHAYIAVADDPIPHDSHTLRLLVRTLLSRIEADNFKQGRAVQNIVHLLAALEKLSPREAFSSESPLIESLAVPKEARHQHWDGVVKWQRDWLVEFLQVNKFPLKGTPKERGQWFQDHHSAILDGASRIRCVCEYSHSLEQTSEAVEAISGEMQLIIYILSDLHGLDVPAESYDGQIYKLLKCESA